MKIYEEREEVQDLQPCRKRPIVVHAKMISEPFRVKMGEDYLWDGKPGDYLMRDENGVLSICDQETFLNSYDFFTLNKENI